jgi:hypothetical protein
MGARLGGITHTSATSVLTLIELVDGMIASQDEYRRRRANLLDLEKAHIHIWWDLPEARFYQAFPFLETVLAASENVIDPLRGLLKRVKTCASLDLFDPVLREPTTRDLLDWIGTYEERLSRNFIDAIRTGAGALRQVFQSTSAEQRDRARRLGLRVDGSFSDFCHSLGAHPLNRDLTLYTLVASLCGTWLEDSSDDTLRAVFESYDNSIDAWVDAFAHYSSLKHSQGGSAGRNDGFDLAHFLYLTPGVTLITEDTGMRAVAQAVGWPIASIDSLVSEASSI